MSHVCRIASAPPPPPQKIAAARSFICSDHARAEQEHRLDGVLLAPGPQVRQEQPHWEKSRSTLACVTRERSESDVTGPHRSGVGWVLVLVGLFIDAL